MFGGLNGVVGGLDETPIRKRFYDLHSCQAHAQHLTHESHYVSWIVLAVRVGPSLHLILVDHPLQCRPRPEPSLEIPRPPPGKIGAHSALAAGDTVPLRPIGP